MFGHLLGWYTTYTFSGLLARCKIHFASSVLCSHILVALLHSTWASSIFGRATITLGIGPHSSWWFLVAGVYLCTEAAALSPRDLTLCLFVWHITYALLVRLFAIDLISQSALSCKVIVMSARKQNFISAVNKLMLWICLVNVVCAVFDCVILFWGYSLSCIFSFWS